MIALISRNLKIYFRDRSAVFFSLMSVFVALGIYFLFLADNLEQSLAGIDHLTFLLDSWFLAGSLAIMSVTITLGSYGTMVEDETYNIRKDFLSSPVKRSTVALSYMISSCAIGIIMSLIVLGLGEFFIIIRGGEILSFVSLLKILGLIIVSVISSSSMMYFIASFLHSNSSYSGASTVIGTLIGFLVGLYMPIGSLPEGVQSFIKVIPTSHMASLFRQVLMEQPIASGMANAPAEVVREFQEVMGMTLHIGDTEISIWMSLAFILVVTVIFYILSLMKLSRKKV